MADYFDKLPSKSIGSWVIHHGQKAASSTGAAAAFPALDTASKAAVMLSQLAGSEQLVVPHRTVEAFGQAAGLNPKLEVPALLNILKEKRLIEVGRTGDVEVLGLTTHATVQHAAEIFADQQPSSDERAAIAIAELTSARPVREAQATEFVSDEFELAKEHAADLLSRCDQIGFVDAEGAKGDKLLFNGNLFRRESIEKVKRVIDSLSSPDAEKVRELDAILAKKGCVAATEAEMILGEALFSKLRAASMYDLMFVSNGAGDVGFVTKPSAFHKFSDPIADDAFDLAKLLVAALTYGMTQSSSGRGRIDMIGALLRRLIAGGTVGPATAIGEDYRVLEMKGVIQVRKAPTYGHTMKLIKRDVGELALAVLTTGEASAEASLRPFPGSMTGYTAPERSRQQFRQKSQSVTSKKQMRDVLEVLRTGGRVL